MSSGEPSFHDICVTVLISFCFLFAKTWQRTNQQINNRVQQVGTDSGWI